MICFSKSVDKLIGSLVPVPVPALFSRIHAKSEKNCENVNSNHAEVAHMKTMDGLACSELPHPCKIGKHMSELSK